MRSDWELIWKSRTFSEFISSIHSFGHSLFEGPPRFSDKQSDQCPDPCTLMHRLKLMVSHHERERKRSNSMEIRLLLLLEEDQIKIFGSLTQNMRKRWHLDVKQQFEILVHFTWDECGEVHREKEMKDEKSEKMGM
eukprot:290552_1